MAAELHILDNQPDTPADPPADVSAHVAEMSEPQEHAIEQQRARESVSNGEAVDSGGATFDPSIHSVGSDGKGIFTAKGLWRRRRGSVSSGASGVGNRQRSIVGTVGAAGAQPVADDSAKARSAGIAAAQTFLMLAGALGGPEWKPIINERENEQAQMEEAWGNYFVAKGVTDFPPGLVLVICCVGYSARRFTSPQDFPQTQSRAQRFKEWVGGKIGRWRARRQAKKAGIQRPTGVMA
jgi:hypothetical protein